MLNEPQRAFLPLGLPSGFKHGELANPVFLEWAFKLEHHLYMGYEWGFNGIHL